MKKSSVSIMYDAEKLSAVKMYMEQRDLNLKDEIEKSIESMYSKFVPANVREFIDLKSTYVKPKKSKENKSIIIPTQESEI